MKNVGIVMAAGFGRRFEDRLPKQYHKIHGKEILTYSGLIFENEKCIDGIIFVADEKFINYVRQNIVKKYKFTKVIDVIQGGMERFNSVFNAIKYLEKINPENVFIHDGVRPFVSSGLVKKMAELLNAEKAVIPVVKIPATLKMIKDGYVKETLKRENVRLSATPQAFKFEILKKLYVDKFINKIKPTDESFVFEKAGIKVRYIDEDERNVKITTKNDFEIMKTTLK
jgi:2-C-methyl-D-erythritol 4-phosphate cytidylyltransferase